MKLKLVLITPVALGAAACLTAVLAWAVGTGLGVEAIPEFVLIGPDGKIVARAMRDADIKKAVASALAKTP